MWVSPHSSELVYVMRCIFDASRKVINEMGGACGTYGGGESGAQGSGGEIRGKETTREAQMQMGG